MEQHDRKVKIKKSSEYVIGREERSILKDIANTPEVDGCNTAEKEPIEILKPQCSKKSLLCAPVYKGAPKNFGRKKKQPLRGSSTIQKGSSGTSEYVVDIYDYLNQQEPKYKLRDDFLENHKITSAMRQSLINWLVKVQLELKMNDDSLHLTIPIIDKFLENNKDINKSKLGIVGVTALYIASKYEEASFRLLDKLVCLVSDSSNRAEILSMEKRMLVTLNYELGRPTSLQFLRRYTKISKFTKEHYNFSEYLIVLAMMDHKLSAVLPSTIAAAACCLTIALHKKKMDLSQAWSPMMIHCSGYKIPDIRPVMARLANLLVNFDKKKCGSVQEKFFPTLHSRVVLSEKSKILIVTKLAGEVKH